MTEAAAERRLVLDEAGFQALARHIAATLQPPLVIYLQGELGAGKTTIARALIQALGYRGRVKSPTYGLLEHYSLEELEVLHLDLYRLAEEGELEFLGITDLIDSKTLLLVEWPDRGGRFLPRPDLVLQLEGSGETRALSCEAQTVSGNAVSESITTFGK